MCCWRTSGREFSSGSASRWDVLRSLNPGLVYCAVSGFGQTGPMRGRPAYDQIIQGLSGIMSVTGTPETAPIRTGFPIADTLGGYAAAFAISAALVKRSRTGAGSFLDVSMLETAIAAMGWVVSDYLIARPRTPVPWATKTPPRPRLAPSRPRDGALNIAANKQEQYVELCTALGRPELLDGRALRITGSAQGHRAELKDELEKTLSQRSAADWDELLAEYRRTGRAGAERRANALSAAARRTRTPAHGGDARRTGSRTAGSRQQRARGRRVGRTVDASAAPGRTHRRDPRRARLHRRRDRQSSTSNRELHERTTRPRPIGGPRGSPISSPA